jgi:predicted RNase H-like nuclease (RuvC/YqgF family)
MKTTNSILTVAAFAGTLFFASCNNDDLEKKMAAKTDSVVMEKDSVLASYIRTLDEIDSNLDEIRDKRGLIVLGPGSNVDGTVPKKEQILRNIAMINDLLAENQEKMENLEKQLSQSRSKNASLNTITKSYSAKIAEAEKEMDALKQELAALAFTKSELEAGMSQLKADNAILVSDKQQLTEQVATLDKKIHTAWYTVGTRKELKTAKVVETDGGVLGIGRTQTLSGSFDKNVFTEVDTKNTTVISLNSSRAKLITRHPEQSYTIEKTGAGMLTLRIKDPELFWSISKYLVVETKA